ncbi:MAG TPA: HAD family hydrolase [Sporichthya sp.]|nr:HAD family hydrolase [Sporichthya sp.]
MGGKEPIEAYLFDLDGVLRVWDEAEVAAIEARAGLAPGRLSAVAHDLDRYGPAMLGEVTDNDWRASVVGALVADGLSADAAVEVVLDWSANLGRVDPEVAEVVAGIRDAGGQVALVVNATDRLELDLVVLGLDSVVDTVVSSARTGIALPDAAMYEIAAGIMAVPVPRCAYVGPHAELVAGAERIGMTGHLFDGVSGLRAIVETLSAR